jgi:hypothetical protein
MSQARSATGILIARSTLTSPATYVTIAELVTLTPPPMTRNEIETTNHNEGVESKILGILRHGQVTGECNWIPSDPTHGSNPGGIIHDIQNNVAANWKITFPGGTGAPVFSFGARVQNWQPVEATTDAPMRFSFTLTLYTGLTVTAVP